MTTVNGARSRTIRPRILDGPSWRRPRATGWFCWRASDENTPSSRCRSSSESLPDLTSRSSTDQTTDRSGSRYHVVEISLRMHPHARSANAATSTAFLLNPIALDNEGRPSAVPRPARPLTRDGVRQPKLDEGLPGHSDAPRFPIDCRKQIDREVNIHALCHAARPLRCGVVHERCQVLAGIVRRVERSADIVLALEVDLPLFFARAANETMRIVSCRCVMNADQITRSILPIKVFDSSTALVGSLARTGHGNLASSSSAFYSYRNKSLGFSLYSEVTRVSDLAIDVGSWFLHSLGIEPYPNDAVLTSFTVSWDGQKFYYAGINRNVVGRRTVHVYDVSEETATSFVTESSGGVAGISCLHDGSIVVAWWFVGAPEIRRYDQSGTLLWKIVHDSGSSQAYIARGNDATTFWIWSGQNLSQIRTRDGALLNSFSVAEYAYQGTALLVSRTDFGNELFEVSFAAGRDIQIDGSSAKYVAPHWHRGGS